MRRSNGWAERGREIVAAERDRRPSPLLPAAPCQHPKESLRMRNTIGGFEFRVRDDGPAEFRHGLEVWCAACDKQLPEDSPKAREAVMFYLSHNPAAKAARSLGSHLGIRGTRRPAFGAERKADI